MWSICGVTIFFKEDKELKICDERTLKIISHYNKHSNVYDGLCLA